MSPPQNENNDAEIALHFDVPILPKTQHRRFWHFTYEARRITALVDSIPSSLGAAIAAAVRRLQPPGCLPRANLTSPTPPPFFAENRDAVALAEELRFGSVRLNYSTHPLGDNGANLAEAAISALNVGSVEGGDTGGNIMPLVELDMLCLLLHCVFHGGRRRTARYLRVWQGGGAAAFVLWETEREGENQVRPPLETARARGILTR